MSTKIVSYKDYVAGWLESSIHDFLAVLSADSPGAEFALITCLDSNPIPASLRDTSPELKPIKSKLQILGDALLLPTDVLLKADSRNRIFFGFDEVWFFPTNMIRPKPRSASLVGPARVDQARFNKLRKWLLDESCSLALGDGEGLNFVVRAQGAAKSLLGYSIEQPEPALVSG